VKELQFKVIFRVLYVILFGLYILKRINLRNILFLFYDAEAIKVI